MKPQNTNKYVKTESTGHPKKTVATFRHVHSIVPFGRGAWQHASERTGTPKPTRKKHIELSSHNGLETVTAAYCNILLFLSLRLPLPKKHLGRSANSPSVQPGAFSPAFGDSRSCRSCTCIRSSKLTLPPQLAQQRQRAEQLLCLSRLGYNKLPHNSSTDFESSCVSITPRSGRPVGSCRALMTRLGRLRPCVERRTQILPTGSDRHTNGSAFWTTNRMPYQSRCTEAQKA